MANAILAAILSFLIPGLGQAYAGDMKKGIIFFIVFLIIIGLYMFVLNKYLPFNIIELIFGLYAAYDGYQMAKA
jgi:TM2 domain-containing membrane protein YozV